MSISKALFRGLAPADGHTKAFKACFRDGGKQFLYNLSVIESVFLAPSNRACNGDSMSWQHFVTQGELKIVQVQSESVS